MEGKELEVGPFLPTPFAFLGHLMTGTPLSGRRGPQGHTYAVTGGLNRNKTPLRLHFDTEIYLWLHWAPCIHLPYFLVVVT